MPIDWAEYDNFDWAGSSQAPLPGPRREAVAELVADVLGLSAEQRLAAWGSASPPGRYAATVVRVRSGVRHRIQERAAEAGVADVGVKVFKATPDARREAAKLLPFYRHHIHRLPGLPNQRVQRHLEAGALTDRLGEERAFLVQEWVEGDTLEELVRRRWPGAPIAGTLARSLIEQLLGGIVIPLWAAGTIWWDVRDANYCLCARTHRLMMIDVDSLAAYADEILETPAVWARRDRGRLTALSRLRQMCGRLLLAQAPPSKKKIETALAQAWEAELVPALSRLGKSEKREAAEASLQRFLRWPHFEG